MLTVTFEYDETLGKWEVMVSGAKTELEALQGFNAVIYTCRDATPDIRFNKAILQSDKRYKISVGRL